ncbi:MAG: hypothetical protein MSJ26_06605 [Oscillospiraceae bacterium]|nr:hypothetical protein [Oscillospiraceae bacterium]
MKRIITACLEQTIKFEAEEELDAYKAQLDRKSIKYRILGTEKSGSGIIVHIKKQYNTYDVGDFFD